MSRFIDHSTLRERKDTVAGALVNLVGATVLLTFVVLIGHLISESLPILTSPSVEKKHTYSLPLEHQVIALSDVFEGNSILSRKDCRLYSLGSEGTSLIPLEQVGFPCSHAFQVTSWKGQDYLAEVSSSGIVRINPVAQFKVDTTQIKSPDASLIGRSFSFSVPVSIWSQATQWKIDISARWVAMQVFTNTQVYIYWFNRENPELSQDMAFPIDTHVLAIPDFSQVAVTADKLLAFYSHTHSPIADYPLDAPIVWWQLTENRKSLMTFDEEGTFTRWVIKNNQGTLTFKPTYQVVLASKAKPVAMMSHPLNNGLLLATEDDTLYFMNRVTGEVISQQSLNHGIEQIKWFDDNLYILSDNRIYHYLVQDKVGFVTYSALFEAQEFEGYHISQSVYQTTTAADFEETKYSLKPLLVGSVKASLLALLIAIPMSVGAAIYTGYFAKSRLRTWLKPTIEFLEAVPSVVIGFIAAIWLTPLAERFLVAFGVFLIFVPVILFISALVQRKALNYLPKFFRYGSELYVSLALIIGLGYWSMTWLPDLIVLAMGVDPLNSLSTESGSPLGKTTIIVAIALGVAIAPSIYSLSEDAIASVPKSLQQASFALGATRLQTLQKVVLRIAFPGIVAAVMLGFGRAFGETMILLMVTGNTPLDSWSLLEGLRALTANLTIELPEAEVDSTHYHILFLTALLLFAFTFVINTLAELLKRYARKVARHD